LVLARWLFGGIVSPGEWLCFVLGVQQTCFLVLFARTFDMEYLPPGYQQWEHAKGLWYWPRLAAMCAGLLAIFALRKHREWFWLFGVVSLGSTMGCTASADLWSGQSVLTMGAPLVMGLSALWAMAMTISGTEYPGQTRRAWAHWLGMALALFPAGWFIY